MEFEANGQTYRSTKIDTFKQLFVIRRLAPIVKDMLTAQIITIFNSKKKGEEIDPMLVFGAFSSFAEAAGNIKDDDMEYIIDVCLHSCQRKQAEAWVPVMSEGVLRFQDITPAGMLIISYNVLSVSVGNFFSELRSMLGMAEETVQG